MVTSESSDPTIADLLIDSEELVQTSRAALRLAVSRGARTRLYRAGKHDVLEIEDRLILILDRKARTVTLCSSLEAAAEQVNAPLVFSQQLPALRVRQALAANDSASRFSEYEKDILFLVSRGLSNSEIAFRLNKSESTIKNRMSIIFTKLGIHSRSQLVATVLDLGILTDVDTRLYSKSA